MQGSYRIGAFHRVPAALAARGIPLAEALRGTGLAADDLARPDNYVAIDAIGRLLERGAALAGDPAFWLETGRGARLADLGPVADLMRAAPTLGEALVGLATHRPRTTRGPVAFLMHQGGMALLGHAVTAPELPGLAHLADATMAMAVTMLHELAGAAPAEVWLAHAAPADPAPWRRVLGVAPRFDAEATGLLLPLAVLDRPLRTADPARHRAAAAAIEALRAMPEPGLAEHLAAWLRARAVFSPGTIEEAGAWLGLHPRTLERRLRAEGETYRALRARVRYAVARELLAGTRMQAADVGLALGYADASAFNRAFRAWSGQPPQLWRDARRARDVAEYQPSRAAVD